jgi:hypothetical protein
MFYADFRAARTLMEQPQYYIMPWDLTADMAQRSSYYPYPRAYLSTRKELEPLFSGAVVARVSPELALGLTYQLLMQDQKYYDVPQDIYRAVAGADYTGRSLAMGNGGLPTVDKYIGDDNMHQSGHFLSLFGRYTPFDGTDVGLKVGRVMFDRHGAVGSSNLWEANPSSTSLWANMEKRDQRFGQWELAAGARQRLSETMHLGVSGGYLWGTATQAMVNGDSSYYGYVNTGTSSLYQRSLNKLQLWRTTGGAIHASAELTARLSPSARITFLYRREWSDLTLNLGSSVIDTGMSVYTWTNNGFMEVSTSRSFLSDTRAGSGTQKCATDRATVAVEWTLSEKVVLSIGGQLEFQTRETRTSEAVLVTGRSASASTPNDYHWLYGQGESKDLDWAFDVRHTSFRVPVILTIKASQVASVLLGITRDMSSWRIDDVTLEKFRYRREESNGVITEKASFAERTTLPREEKSDIRTTFMAGLTLSSSDRFQARLLMVPVFADEYNGPQFRQLQWWLGITVTP